MFGNPNKSFIGIFNMDHVSFKLSSVIKGPDSYCFKMIQAEIIIKYAKESNVFK